jgi:hypothetical protein
VATAFTACRRLQPANKPGNKTMISDKKKAKTASFDLVFFGKSVLQHNFYRNNTFSF